MRIATIIGARPQFIKAATVSRAFLSNGEMEEFVIHTGQHFDENMSDVFFSELELKTPDVNLGISSLPHGAMTGRMLEAIEGVLIEKQPDCVLVYGDTDSTLAAALAAVKLHIPVAHVEAGLRAFDLSIPEEVNRVMTDHVSDFLFTPTPLADSNLQREGLAKERIYRVGDVMQDAADIFTPRALERSGIHAQYGIEKGAYCLATLHRPVNVDSAADLRRVCAILDAVSEQLPVVWPVHPRTLRSMERHSVRPQKVQCIPPAGYFDMLALEAGAALIVTDSGGVQKEAYFQRVPCITLKAGTEWEELVEHGWNHVIPPSDDADAVCAAILARIGTQGDETPLYGDGHAAEQIVRILKERL